MKTNMLAFFRLEIKAPPRITPSFFHVLLKSTSMDLCRVSLTYHSSPLLFFINLSTCWYAGRAIYTECWGTIPQYSVAVTRSCDTLVLTTSSSSSPSATSSPFFFLPWQRVSWTFLVCHYASFPTRSLGFLELFSTFPLSVFGACHEVQPPAWPLWEPSDLSGLKPDGPPWVSLAFRVFRHSLEAQPPVRLFW
jgi:hypothetical protein